MTWLLLPQPTVTALLGNPMARHWLATRLPSDIDSNFMVESTHGTSCLGRGIELNHSANLLALWPPEGGRPVNLIEVPLVSVWSEAEESTVWSVEDEARAHILERICQLAQRTWHNQPLPDHWEAKKVEGFPSVFAAGPQLMNLRFAYDMRTVSGHRVVDIGTLYYARRQQKTIRVPLLDTTWFERLPQSVDPPEPESVRQSRPMVESPVLDREDRDLVIALPEGESRNLFSTRYPEWLSESGPLTKQQRRVIAHKVQRPLRVHGPAGSGKTLVLVLKALHLLRSAQDERRVCHVLIVVSSNAVRSTIRTAIEAIDDRGFLATTKRDPQYLDVETLHGWCIRELGLEYGPRYVLEIDPIASKEQQVQILRVVIDEAIGKRCPGLKNLLSADFIARIEGSRDQLIRDMAWETAIRIKGRGFRPSDQQQYVKSPMKSFVGRGENAFDRDFIFHMYKMYEKRFEEQGLLDTDDVVLSIAARLSSSLWDRQRKHLGYDYVAVDETHLFNENERRVLPYLTRGTTDYLPLVMTFDEAQSIGGHRSTDLDKVGILHTEKQTLTYVHRCSPDILALARDLVERSALVFSEFGSFEPVARMRKAELRLCRKPELLCSANGSELLRRAASVCRALRTRNYHRVALISFDFSFLPGLLGELGTAGGLVHHVRERGELLAATPTPGIYVMTPEACGGLEFDAVVLLGVDEGRVPPSIEGMGPQGYLSAEEEACMELYTAITRARYRLVLISDSSRGLSPMLRPCLAAGLIQEAEEL